MEKLQLRGHVLCILLSLFVLPFLMAACASGGGGEDGDLEVDVVDKDTCDIECDPGCYVVNCECKCFGDEDGDLESADSPDNDGDGSEAEDSDDTEGDEDTDRDNADGDIEIPDFDIDPEPEDTCVCDLADPFSCGDGYYCDGCYCQPEDEEGDGDTDNIDSDTILCKNGKPMCYGFDSENDVDMNIGHEACAPNMACDVASGCCTLDDVACSNPIGCPSHWHCLSGVNVCDYECLNDSDCRKKYKSAAWSCSDNGWCIVADGDEEEDGPEPCSSCDDCLEDEFCSSVTGICERQPDEDGCCNDNDCTVTGFACDPAEGRCKWNGTIGHIGRINGTVRTSVDFAGFTYVVKCYNEDQNLEAQSENLSPQYSGGVYSVNYNLFQLSEGEKTLKITAIHLPGLQENYHANPVTINYLTQDQTYVTGKNFYIGVANPELGSVGGTVKIDPAYNNDYIKVQLLKMGPNGWLVQKTAELFPEDQDGDLRRFAFVNLNPGSTHTTVSYYLRALIYHGDSIEYDYQPNARVINLANPAQLHYDSEKLFAGYEDSSFGSIVGNVYYPEFYSDESFTRSVKLYSDYQFKYEVGVARIENQEAGGFGYEIRNLEPKTYWVRYESEIYGNLVTALPGPAQTIITVEPLHKDFNVNIYMDVPQPWVGSVSGEISFNSNQISEGLFYVQAFYNSTFTAPASDAPDLVLRYDFDNNTAPYFIDQLDTGNYYIKAWLESPEGAILDQAVWGGATPAAVHVNAESPNPSLKDVSGINLDFNAR